MYQAPFGSKLFNVYGPRQTGWLKLNFDGSLCFSKTCFGMIQAAFHLTVKIE